MKKLLILVFCLVVCFGCDIANDFDTPAAPSENDYTYPDLVLPDITIPEGAPIDMTYQEFSEKTQEFKNTGLSSSTAGYQMSQSIKPEYRLYYDNQSSQVSSIYNLKRDAVKEQYENGEISAQKMYETLDAVELEWIQYMHEIDTLWKKSRAWGDYTIVVEIYNTSVTEQSVSAIILDESKEQAYISDPITVSPGRDVYTITIPSYGYHFGYTYPGFMINR